MLQAIAYTENQPFDVPTRRPARGLAPKSSAAKLLGVIRRQAIIVIGVTAFALTLGLTYAILSPPLYRSAAELLIDPHGAQDATSGDKTSLIDVQNRRNEIMSSPILEAAVKQAHLAQNPLFGGPPAVPLAERIERAAAVLAKAADVVRGDRADVLDIEVTTADPVVSADVANAIAHVYVARDAAAPSAAAAPKDRVEALRHEVEQADAAVAAFRANTNLPAVTQEQPVVDRQLADLNYQLAMARVHTADAQAKVTQIDQLSRAKADPANLPEGLTSPDMVTLRGQYARLLQQENTLSRDVGPRYPALIQIQEQLRQLHGSITAEAERIAQAARADLSRAKANEAALQRGIDRLSGTNGADAAAVARLQELERAAAAKRTLYQSALDAAKEAEAAQAPVDGSLQVISDAAPALSPVGPPLALVLAGALLFGIGAGTGLGCLREALSDKIMTEEALAAATGGLPLLAAYRSIGAGAPEADADGGVSLLRRLCPQDGGEQARLIALVGLRHDPLRADLLGELAQTARQEGFRLKQVTCVPDEMPRAAARRARMRRESISLVELMRSDPEHPTVLGLRETVLRFGEDSDLVLLDTPPLLDVGMPPALIQAADAAVLVVAPSDLTQRSLETLLAYVTMSAVQPLGVIINGDVELG